MQEARYRVRLRWPQRIAAGLAACVALLVVLSLLELALYPAERRLGEWTPARPGFDELVFDARVGFQPVGGFARIPHSRKRPEHPVVVLDDDLIGRSAPSDELGSEIATRLGAAGLAGRSVQTLWLPFANSVQKALWLYEVPEGGTLVLCVSLADVVGNARSSLVGHALPLLTERDGSVLFGGLSQEAPNPPSGFERILARIPTLRIAARRSPRLPLAGKRTGLFPEELWPYRRSGAPEETKRYAQTKRALRLLANRTREVGASFVVLYVPTAVEVFPESLGACLAALALDTRDFESPRMRRRLADLCSELGVGFADPLAAFLRATRDKRPLVDGDRPYKLTASWNASGRGHLWRALATALAGKRAKARPRGASGKPGAEVKGASASRPRRR